MLLCDAPYQLDVAHLLVESQLRSKRSGASTGSKDS